MSKEGFVLHEAENKKEGFRVQVGIQPQEGPREGTFWSRGATTLSSVGDTLLG